MKTCKSALLAVLGGTMAATIAPARVAAQAAYGSYVGVGGSIGNNGNGSGVVAVRYHLINLPVSIRAQGFIGDGVAVVPTISYDYDLNFQTDAYLGAGVSFADGDTPVGDRTSFALQPGIDHAIPDSNVVVFGNAIIAFEGDRDDGTTFSLQGGVGLQF